MMNFTTDVKRKNGVRPWAVAAWLIIWQVFSVLVGHEILLASPVSVIWRLLRLAGEAGFWSSISFSLWRIASGFLLATCAGILLAALSARFRRMGEFLAPMILAIKSTPVASFIILVLIWANSRNLSVIISFLMVLPIIYTNVQNGIQSADTGLIEMAGVFRVATHKRILYIYVSQVLPHFQSACVVGLGLCWKAGIAAEVIGIPAGSIGERLYMAKIYLATPDLFAWTLTIILLSIVFERLFMFLLRLLVVRIEG